MSYVTLSLESIHDWGDRIETLVALLDNHPYFRPDKWGASEPERCKFDPVDLPHMQHQWSNYMGFLLAKKVPRVQIQLVRQLPKRTNWLAVHFDEVFFNSDTNIQRFLAFAAELFAWGDMIHAYACHKYEFEQKNVLSAPTLIEGKLISTGGMDLQKCLPGIYWANFFGNAYVNWFGEKKLRTSPCYSLQELPDGGLLLLTGSNPLEYETALASEPALRSHLGEDAFFDVKNPTRPCRSPFKDGIVNISTL